VGKGDEPFQPEHFARTVLILGTGNDPGEVSSLFSFPIVLTYKTGQLSLCTSSILVSLPKQKHPTLYHSRMPCPVRKE
jgi:hypothetical protein